MGRYLSTARKAANLTNKQLATEISALLPTSNDRFREFFPRKRDQEAFLALMAEVEAERDADEQLAYLEDNLASVGGVVFKALSLLL